MPQLIAVIIVLILLVTNGSLLQAQPLNESVESCINRVSAHFAPLKKPDLSLERQFQADLTLCGSPSLPKVTAVCIGSTNYDYARLAMQLKDKSLTPAQYLQRVRDRQRKAGLCVEDEAWSTAYAHGDRDNDLVPDKFDGCPDTPPLVATDDSGCPMEEPNPKGGPSPEDVNRVFQLHTAIGNPKCSGAPVPTVPAVAKLTSIGFPEISPPKLRSEVRRVRNQPPGCPVVYQLEIEEIVPVVLPDSAQTYRTPLRLRMMLRPRDALNASDPDAELLVFESLHPQLVVLFHQGAKAKIRAFNGNGTASPWSRNYGRLGR